MGNPNKIIAVAPMMAWTDRHCRYLHRLYHPSALLFTEMVTTGALLHGQQWHQLDYHPSEHPVALQLGGSDPESLAQCSLRAAELGYDEINLNVGCPSDRVQQGTFGACLMLNPELVAKCISAMQAECDTLVSVKCRLGVDDFDSDDLLNQFIDTVAAAGCQRFYIHARKAILGGLSPAQNRSIPPLQPERVQALKARRDDLEIIINGGITEAAEVHAYNTWADGVMIGRAAYHRPMLLAQLYAQQQQAPVSDPWSILSKYRTYMTEQLAQGERLHAMTRHLLSSCNGMPGARRFRQILSDNKRLKQNDINVFDEALQQVYEAAA